MLESTMDALFVAAGFVAFIALSAAALFAATTRLERFLDQPVEARVTKPRLPSDRAS